jgi:hypothetical protein
VYAAAPYSFGGKNMEQLGYDSDDGCKAPGFHLHDIIAAGAAKALVPRDSGAMVLLDQAAGSIVTLPTPVKGMVFDVAISVSVTSNSHVVKTKTPATEFITGGIQQMINANAVSEGQFANGTSHVSITMNGTTTGGLIGTVLRFVAISSTVWVCKGLVASSGTLATPFAT